MAKLKITNKGMREGTDMYRLAQAVCWLEIYAINGDFLSGIDYHLKNLQAILRKLKEGKPLTY